jgi:hypothetical protein
LATEAAATGLRADGTERIEIDVVREVHAAPLREAEGAPALPGTEGIFAVSDSGKRAFVLPGEVIGKGLVQRGKPPPRIDEDKALALMCERAALSSSELDLARQYRFRATALVESKDHSRVLPVQRGMVEPEATVTTEGLLAHVRSGAEYLARMLSGDGRYAYTYHPLEDRVDASYGWLRHAGTTYALLEAYGELHEPIWLTKAEQALGLLERKLRGDAASGGSYIADTTDEEQQKTGGAGLALLAFCQYTAVTGQTVHVETMRSLARFIAAQQAADGHFRANVDTARSVDKALKKEPIYYQGEGALGLLRLYALERRPEYLETARRAVDWVVDVRDANVSLEHQEHDHWHDHWMAYALRDLYEITRDRRYLDHAMRIAQAIGLKQHQRTTDSGADWPGSFYLGESTLAATRLEAYDAVEGVERLANQSDGSVMLRASEVGAFLAGQQFDEDNAYFLKKPGRAIGGVRESPSVMDVRIDYVQHAISAWLHLARLMRAESDDGGAPEAGAAVGR